MIGELEAAAADWFRDLVKHRRRKHEAPIGQPCANCDTPLQGQFCHVCGQNSDQHKRAILHLFWEAIEGLFHLDGRLWRTMPALFFRPGRLAHDYIEGRAARHVPPFRTFLVSLLLFIFAAEHAIHVIRADGEAKAQAQAAKLATPQGRATEAARLRADAVKERESDIKEAVADRLGELKQAGTDKERRAAEVDYLTELRSAQRGYDRQMAKADKIARGDTSETTDGMLIASPERRRELAADIRNDKAFGAAPDNEAFGGTPTKSGIHVRSNIKGNWFKEGVAKAVENPDYYLTVMFGWAHRIAILLLPIVGLSLAAVYFYKRKYFLYDHLLVAMNILSFAFLTNALGLVLPMSWWPFWTAVLAIWTPINLFQTLRGAYGSSWFGAFVKTLVVWFMTFLAFTALLVGLLLFTLSQV